MGSYRLLTYVQDGIARAGVLVGDQVYPASALIKQPGVDPSSVLTLLETWETSDRLLARAVDALQGVQGRALAETELRAPILYPNAFYCAAANYRDHMHAMAVRLNQPDEPDPHDLDIKPFHFIVPGRTCTSGPTEPVRMPAHAENIDWEIELAAVIGKPARRVPVERALEHVAAYTIGNDVSVRDMHYLKIPNVPLQSLFRSDFIAMKGFDSSCVIGPWLTPAREIADPQRLALKLWLDDELMQDSSTSEMIFNVAEQISYLSSRVTLLPGDIVMTGTPAGTGMERDRFLRAGQTIKTSIEGIGEMSQTVVAAAA